MPSFAPSHRRSFSFPNLRATNQETNSRIYTLLTYWRACHRPTHHAKQRATSLNLSVDTGKAYACDYKKVSSLPLPVLELEPSPPPMIQLVYPDGCAPIHIDSDGESSADHSESSCSPSSSSTSTSSMSSFEDDLIEPYARTNRAMYLEPPQAKRPARPILRCIIPTHPPVERSYFSPDSEYSPACLTSQMESLTTSSTLVAPQGVYPIQGGLLIAEDIRPLSWGCSETLAPSSSSSSSSSNGSSSTPLTPEDAAYPPRSTRSTKRKYAAIQEDASDDGDVSSSCDEIRHVFDKRRKFERKSWVGIVAGGQPIRRPSAPVHGLRSSSARRHVSASDALRASSRL